MGYLIIAIIFLTILFFWVISAVIDDTKNLKREIDELRGEINDLKGEDETPIEIKVEREKYRG